jgi:hypothetical protein
MRPPTAWLRRVLLLLLAVGATACDPCSGVLGCGELRLRYRGEVTQRYVDAPIADARVEFVRTGGPRLERDTLAATTDAQGRFLLEARAYGDADVVGWLRVHDAQGVLVDSIGEMRLRPTSMAGNALDLSLRLPHATVGRYGVLVWRGTDQRAAGVRVEFHRTGGVPTYPEHFSTVTDAAGRFVFAAVPLAEGVVMGDLVFDLAPPYRAERHAAVHFPAVGGGPDQEIAGVWGVGPIFPYMGLLLWGDTREVASGVQVEFRRTGGIPITPEQVVMTSNGNEYGNVRLLPVTPLDYGEVVGELTIRPPAPYPTVVIPDFRLHTVEEDVPFYSVLQVWEIPRE